MAIYEPRDSKGWFWAEFMARGTVRRIPLGTQDPEEAARREKLKIILSRRDQTGVPGRNFGRCPFGQAADHYLWDHAVVSKAKGFRSVSRPPRYTQVAIRKAWRTPEGYLLAQVRKFFPEKQPCMFTVDDVLAYQEWRLENHISRQGVRREINALFRLLTWASIGKQVSAIKELLRSSGSDSGPIYLDRRDFPRWKSPATLPGISHVAGPELHVRLLLPAGHCIEP